MSTNSASKLGVVTIVATCLALIGAWASTAQAQTAKYSLSGNTRAQIGQGLPLPITFQPAPNGKVQIQPNAYVFQTAGPDPKRLTLVQGPTPFGPSTSTAFVAQFNARVVQVRTSLIVNGPAGGTAMFSRGKRTGPKSFTWCPGLPLPTASFNPSCTAPTTAPGAAKASIRYEATTGSLAEGWGFGGTSQAVVGGGVFGGASVVIMAGSNLAPCRHPSITGPQPTNANCVAGFSHVVPATVGAGGGPIGGVNFSTPPPSPGNIHPLAVTTLGNVTKVGATPFGTFPKNNVADYGGPWTTGKVTVRAPLAGGGAETFYLQGGDNRVNGLGSISLVGGGVSARSLSGDNANRGWLNYTISPYSVPSISNGGLILLGAIFFAATMWMVRRAVVTSH